MHRKLQGRDPLIQALLRTLLVLVSVSWLLSASATARVAASPCGDSRTARVVRGPYRGLACDWVTSIGMDLLNDQAVFPAPNGPTTGEIDADRLAEFRIYSLTEDPRFFADITHEIKGLKFQVRSPRGSVLVRGRFIYARASNTPTIYFGTLDLASEDRVAFIEVTYRCYRPTVVFRTEFALTIRGTGNPSNAQSTGPQENRAQVEPIPFVSDLREHENGECADLAVSVSGPTTPIRQGDPFTAVVTVKNVGSTVSSGSQIMLSALRLVTHSASQGTVGVESWRDQRLRYYPGRLEPKGVATLTLVGHTWYSGIIKIPATVSQGWGDCNPANDYAEAEFEVAATIPDLTATWTSAELVFRREFPQSERATARGIVQVRNDGQADAEATRLIVFLSQDVSVGPEDRLLGFWDVPAIPAGGAVNVPVQRELRKGVGGGKAHLVALVDSANSVYELLERNNVVASQPVR